MRIVSSADQALPASSAVSSPSIGDAESHTVPVFEAVRLFISSGSMAEVARHFKVPVYDIKKLARTAEWARELHDLRVAEAAQMDTSLTSILDSTLSQLSERVDEGNPVWTPEGVRYVPLTSTELVRVADVVFDKRQLLRGDATAIVSGDGDVVNRKLEQLARGLRALGAKDLSFIDLPVEKVKGPRSEEVLLSAAG